MVDSTCGLDRRLGRCKGSRDGCLQVAGLRSGSRLRAHSLALKARDG